MKIVQSLNIDPRETINNCHPSSNGFAETVRKFKSLYEKSGCVYLLDCNAGTDYLKKTFRMDFWEHEGTIHDFKDFIIASKFEGVYLGMNKNKLPYNIEAFRDTFMSKPDRWEEMEKYGQAKGIREAFRQTIEKQENDIYRSLKINDFIVIIFTRLSRDSVSMSFTNAIPNEFGRDCFKAIYEIETEPGKTYKCSYIATMKYPHKNMVIPVHIYLKY